MGVGGALLARDMGGREPSRLVLAAACGLAGLPSAPEMDIYQWTLGARQDPRLLPRGRRELAAADLAHAIGNVVFCLLIGPAFVRALERYRRRLEVRWPAPAGAGGCLRRGATVSGFALPQPASGGLDGGQGERYSCARRTPTAD